MISVLVVDDSAVVRIVLYDILTSEKDIRVAGTASNAQLALEKIQENRPDVIILDLEMPVMSGLEFMQRNQGPDAIPIVICSSHVERGSPYALEALALGAAEIIKKPNTGVKDFLNEDSVNIVNAVRAAAAANPDILKETSKPAQMRVSKTYEELRSFNTTLPQSNKIIVIGASTGGVQAISSVLQNLDRSAPPIMIVQHMPGGFTKSWAERLNQTSDLDVFEAEDGQKLQHGMAVVANGDLHLVLGREGSFYCAGLRDGPLMNRHKPSVDALFRSAVKYAGMNMMAILMTGMGSDGAEGLARLKKRGAITVAQDEKSSAIFGMPKAAIELGGAQLVLSLESIPLAISAFCQGTQLPVR